MVLKSLLVLLGYVSNLSSGPYGMSLLGVLLWTWCDLATLYQSHLFELAGLACSAKNFHLPCSNNIVIQLHVESMSGSFHVDSPSLDRA